VRKDTKKLGEVGGRTLFYEQDDYHRYKYSAFVTNTDLSDDIVWSIYRQRAEAENQIKELKYDYCLEGFSFNSMPATEFVFRWITIAYNLMSYFRNVTSVNNVKLSLSTQRFNCIAIGAYLSSSARINKIILSVQGKKRDYIEELF